MGLNVLNEVRSLKASPHDFFEFLKNALAGKRRSAQAKICFRPRLGEKMAGASATHFNWLLFQWLSLLRVSLALIGLLLTPSWQSPQAALFLAYLLYGTVLHALGLYRKTVFTKGNWLWIDFAWGIVGSSLLLMLNAAGGKQAEWQPMLPGAVALLIFAYVIAQWASLTSLHKKHLQLLGALNQLPQAGCEPKQLITATLEQLLGFYAADQCFAVIGHGDAADFHGVTCASEASLLPMQGLKKQLLGLPAQCAIVANSVRHHGFLPQAKRLIDNVSSADFDEVLRRSDDLSDVFAQAAWISVPLESHGAVRGRLYLVAHRQPFSAIDIDLLREAMAKFMPLLDIVERVDHLATHAAAQERRKISLDLHDGAIQPYLGLKLGLEALRRKAEPGNVLNGDIDDLYRMTQDSIAELRGYVRGLGGRAQPGAASLTDGLQRQIARFRSFYGFDVALNMPAEMRLNERLTAEVVQMIGESLSNVGRHTTSRLVNIRLSCSADRFDAQIINHAGANDAPWQAFTPKSLTRRAADLGGRVDVKPHVDGGTELLLSIPL